MSTEKGSGMCTICYRPFTSDGRCGCHKQTFPGLGKAKFTPPKETVSSFSFHCPSCGQSINMETSKETDVASEIEKNLRERIKELEMTLLDSVSGGEGFYGRMAAKYSNVIKDLMDELAEAIHRETGVASEIEEDQAREDLWIAANKYRGMRGMERSSSGDALEAMVRVFLNSSKKKIEDLEGQIRDHKENSVCFDAGEMGDNDHLEELQRVKVKRLEKSLLNLGEQLLNLHGQIAQEVEQDIQIDT